MVVKSRPVPVDAEWTADGEWSCSVMQFHPKRDAAHVRLIGAFTKRDAKRMERFGRWLIRAAKYMEER